MGSEWGLAIVRTGAASQAGVTRAAAALVGLPDMRQALACTIMFLPAVALCVLWSWERRALHWQVLEDACKAKTKASLESEGLAPVEWRSSLKSTLGGEITYLNGSWLAGGRRIQVLCSARLGDSGKIAFEVDDAGGRR